MRTIRSKLTYANVYRPSPSSLLLRGGAALAATQLRRTASAPRQIKNSGVTAEIKNGTVTGTQIQTNSS